MRGNVVIQIIRIHIIYHLFNTLINVKNIQSFLLFLKKNTKQIIYLIHSFSLYYKIYCFTLTFCFIYKKTQ